MTAAADLPLESAAAVRSLSREDAARRIPVKLRGTVVLKVGRGRVFNIHDGVECVAVHFFKADEQGVWKDGRFDENLVNPGTRVEVTGFTDPAGFVPVVVPVSITKLGHQPLPAPKRVDVDQLLSGSETSQLVEVEGVVREARPLSTGFSIALRVNGHPFDVKIQQEHGLDPARLVDSRIRISGCASAIFNLRSETIGVRLLVQNQDRIRILRPPPEDPFHAPQVPLSGLLPFSRAEDHFHRRVTRGVVNFIQPGRFFFLQEGATGVRVDTLDTPEAVGDWVEVSGFVDTSCGIASLAGAVTRRVGRKTPAMPVDVTAAELLRPPVAHPLEPVSRTDPYGALVRIEGLLRDHQWLEREKELLLRLDSSGTLVDLRLPWASGNEKCPWPAGARVAAAGVCEPTFDVAVSPLKFPVVTGLTLWSRSPADLVILEAPSWWTPVRLAGALGGSLVILGLSLAWTWMLRRRINRQMAVISDKLQGEAVAAERNRMARDLHDTLEQMLAGVSLQLDDVEESLCGGEQLESLGRVRRMLEFTRTEARRSVWELRSQVLERHGLEAAIRSMAEAVGRATGPVIECSVTGMPYPLDAMGSYNLLRMCQEALTNAVKHAAASRISIVLDYRPDAFQLDVTDDGTGFPTVAPDASDNAHFGILGMRERATRIGASLYLDSTPAGGCRVSITLPRKPPPALP